MTRQDTDFRSLFCFIVDELKTIFFKIIFCIFCWLFLHFHVRFKPSFLIEFNDFMNYFQYWSRILWLFYISYVYKIFFFHRISWLQVFKPFQFLFFQVKMLNHHEGDVLFEDIKHQLQENILHHYLHCTFFEIFNFCNIIHPYKLFTSQYLRYKDSLFYHYLSYIYY